MRRVFLTLSSLLMLVAMLATPASAAPGDTFPKIIPLPNGWQPEGIASGRGTAFYAGSLANGAIYAGDFRTGEGRILVPGANRPDRRGHVPRPTHQLPVRGRRSYGHGARVRCLDRALRARSVPVQLLRRSRFVNDVIVTREAAYFTDLRQAVFYTVPLGAGGKLPRPTSVQAIPLSGDLQSGARLQRQRHRSNVQRQVAGDRQTARAGFSSGWIRRPERRRRSIWAVLLLTTGDGLRFAGSRLYVMQNRLNQIAVVNLNNDLTSGVVERTITDPAFRVPTTIASFGDSLYAVNARFGTRQPRPGGLRHRQGAEELTPTAAVRRTDSSASHGKR